MSRNQPVDLPAPANPPVGSPPENPSLIDPQPTPPTQTPRVVVPPPHKGPRTEEQKREAQRLRFRAQLEAAGKKYGGVENLLKKAREDAQKDLSSGRNEGEGEGVEKE